MRNEPCLRHDHGSRGRSRRRGLELADIVRRHLADYIEDRGGRVSEREERVFRALAACRTAALGGHLYECDHCGHREGTYHSCCDRHCPKCQGRARAVWLDQRRGELLPVEYFHPVFTLPRQLQSLVWANQRKLYGLMFSAAGRTLREVAANPKHLGAEIGVVAVLHTWGQTLQHHPHLHCIVPGGGLSPDGKRWIGCPRGFFLPEKVLGVVFRGKFLAELKQLYDEGELYLPESLSTLSHRRRFQQWLSRLYAIDWVVHVQPQPPSGDAEQALKYLARYMHRVAISNNRLVSLEDGRVTFRYKDYAHGGRWRTMTLDAVEFLRRFALHILPQGFVRVRYYGFLANRHRQAKLSLIRGLLSVPDSPKEEQLDRGTLAEDGSPAQVCPRCRHGHLILVESRPRPRLQELQRLPWPFDTS